MGIENRDYMGGGSSFGGRYRSDGGRWSMVTTLIVINVAVFILQTLFMDSKLLESWFDLSLADIRKGQIWRLLTYDFLHDTSSSFPGHLLFNMLLLYIAGRQVEEKYGRNEFLAFYLIAGVVSGIVFLLWGLFTQSGTPVIGASGAAIAVMVVYAMNWPQTIWYIWGIIPVPVVLLAAISAGMDIIPLLRQLGGVVDPRDNVAHAAHLGGMIFGVLYVLSNRQIMDLFGDWDRHQIRKTFRRRPNLKVHVPDPQDEEESVIPEEVESRLDELLEKISTQGEASLTDDERKFLTETSRRYRDRR